MNDKIEEILLKHSPYVFFGNAVKTELFGETVKHLTTLINQEKKEAVEDFVKYIYSRPSNEWVFPSNMFYEYLKESEYLESEK